MKIEYAKVTMAEIPEGCREINDALRVVDNSGEDAGSNLELYFLKSAKENVVHKFKIYPDKTSGTLSELVNEILKGIFANFIEGLPAAETPDILRSVSIASGLLAEHDMEESKKELDPAGKIFYHLVNGQVLYTDIENVNWEENIKNLNMISDLVDRCRAFIRALMLEDTIEIPSENEGEAPTLVPSFDYVKGEVENFFINNGIAIDYSMFNKEGISDRERLLLMIIDMISIHQELILVSSLMNVENTIRAEYAPQSEPIPEPMPEPVPGIDIPAFPEPEQPAE